MPMHIPTSATTTTAWSGSKLYVYGIALVAATAGLLFGFDIAVINGAIILMRDQFALSEFQTEIAASSLLAGCIAGAIGAGTFSDHFGRRKVLMLAAILFAVSAIGAALPRDLTEFIVARVIGGLAIGMASLLAPLYIAEVSPPQIRGRLVSLNQMAIVTGILLAYLANWLLSFHGHGSWRWMFAVAAVPSALFLLGLFFVPESPRWLTQNGRDGDALAILTRLAGRERAGEEMTAIRESIAEESGTLAELWEPGIRKALVIAVALAVLQQVTGTNTVLFYGSIIFREQVGQSSNSAAIGINVIVGLVMFGATLVALWLIDKLGRRTILMLSAGGMAVSQIGMAIAFAVKPLPTYLILGLILACVASYSVGLAPATWVVLSEIFPTRIRGRAMSVATVSLWVASTILTLTFLSLVSLFTISGAFTLYATMCITTVIVVWRLLPETSGRTLEEICRFWK